MKKHGFILFLIGIFGCICNAQTISGCDFFPKEEDITFTYFNSSKYDKSKKEFRYIYQGNVKIEGKTYRAYQVYVNGYVPEVNQVLYVNCDSNSLILGTGIYSFNRQVVGYSQDITKVVDVNAIPIFEVGMVNTGDFYLPTEIKPNNKIGESWTETKFMHGNQTKVTRTLLDKNLTLEVLGSVFKNVYHIKKEVLIEGGALVGEYSYVQDVYFAKGIGLIKEVQDFGNNNIVVTELDTGMYEKIQVAEQQRVLEEIKDILKKLPEDPELKTSYQNLILNKNNLSMDQLTEVHTEMNNILLRYQSYVKDSIRKQNKRISETKEKINAFNQLESHLKQVGVIDKRLLGTWKLLSTGKSFYKFYEDGMVEIYKENLKSENNSGKKHLFRVTNGNTLESLYKLYQSDEFGYQKHLIDFDVDKKSGKPLIHLKLVYLNSIDSKSQRVKDMYYNNKIYTYIKID
ncbi:hypothetical protein M8845_09270 [Gelidibacter japonicus]|uniref:hypothetical protein n=1 Tax=Gelidibacter japonicus TaxID=1962232 RepID=UPI002021306F|nr:hypothetical protein [Gelidibacter japonicus]MCL8007613.1 hypothetical protein [Gelidibacter japonicus]